MASGGSAVTLPLPVPFAFDAPASWRAIDFISDLHLCAAMPRTFDAWCAHMQHTSADAVVMLGDLFELWVGDDMRCGVFEQQCIDVLAAAACHTQLAFMAGNRDFLLGSLMLQVSGMAGWSDPTVLTAFDRRVLLSHGDVLCLDDTAYQAFRTTVRNADWQAAFLAKPLEERLGIAATIRSTSEARRQFDGNNAADVNASAAVQWMRAVGTPELVHGHTHRPGSNVLAPGFERHVLSDWDLDDSAHPRAEVLRLTHDGFQRLPPVTG